MIYKLCEEVWAGSYPNDQEIQHLSQKRVRAFVDLTRLDERLRSRVPLFGYDHALPYGMRHLRFPLWSKRLPPLEDLLEIVEAVETNKPVYMHCRHGRDRTGVVAALFLMWCGLNMDQALGHIARARGPHSEQSPRSRYHLAFLTEVSKRLDSPGVFGIGNSRRMGSGRSVNVLPFRSGVMSGETRSRTSFLEKVKSLSWRRRRWSPLIAAVEDGQLESVRLLTNLGADINAPGGRSGKTPLMRAAKRGHFEIAGYLVENGANLNAVSRRGFTALDYAAKRRCSDIERLIQNHGTN